MCSALVVAVLSLLYAGDGTGSPFDAWSETAMRATDPSARRLALAIDLGGEPLGAAVLVVAVVAVCLAFRRNRLAVLAATAVGGTVAATTALKPVVGRTIHGVYLAFPSGHTALATSLALVVALLAAGLLRTGALASMLLLLATAGMVGGAMAWSQVDLDTHYLTDTIGGFCTALAVLTATAWLIDQVADSYGGRP